MRRIIMVLCGVGRPFFGEGACPCFEDGFEARTLEGLHCSVCVLGVQYVPHVEAIFISGFLQEESKT